MCFCPSSGRALATLDDATIWAHGILHAKNSLTTEDAGIVETAFQAKARDARGGQRREDNRATSRKKWPRPSQWHRQERTRAIGALGESRDKDHLSTSSPNNRASDLRGASRPTPTMLRFAQHRALGRKVSDEFTVPLAAGGTIAEVHRCGFLSTRPHGGAAPGMTHRSWPARFGSKPIRSPRSRIKHLKQLLSPAAVSTGRKPGRTEPSPVRRGRNCKTKPIIGSSPTMTSFRQIEANRRNARRSTGPVTEDGKHRSRCNAVRHGLTAETVIGTLEDADDYRDLRDRDHCGL